MGLSPVLRSHLDQVALGRESEAVHSVRPAVGPLAELLRRLGERHVGGDGAVDDGLRRRRDNEPSSKLHLFRRQSREWGTSTGSGWVCVVWRRGFVFPPFGKKEAVNEEF